MNTLDQPLSTSKPEFDPAQLRVHFERTLERILALRAALSAGTLDFASAESQAVDEQRVLSCVSQACLLEALDDHLPDTIGGGCALQTQQGSLEEARRAAAAQGACADGLRRSRVG